MDENLDLFKVQEKSSKILSRFESDLEGSIEISGPPGSGKSFIGRAVLEAWEKSGGVSAYIEAEQEDDDRPFSTFSRYLLNRDKPTFSRVDIGLATIRIADIAAGTGGAAGTLFESIARLAMKNRGKKHIGISTEELEIISEIYLASKSKPLLIISDNFHWWDSASLQTLNIMLSGALLEQFPFLSSVRVVFICTPLVFQPSEKSKRVDKVLRRYVKERIITDYCSEEEYPSVLKGLGLTKQIPQETEKELFKITNGNLAMTEKIAHYLNSDSFESRDLLASAEELFHLAFERSISRMEGDGKEVGRILELASNIGLEFSRIELSCLSKMSLVNLETILSIGEGMSYVGKNEKFAKFKHEYHRSFFLNRSEDWTQAQHIEYADCLRQIRPSDYVARAIQHRQGGQLSRASELILSAILKQLRRGLNPYNSLNEELKDSLNLIQLNSTVEICIESYRLLNLSKFKEAIEILDTCSEAVSKYVRSEITYIKCLNLVSLRDERHRNRALEILDHWNEFLFEEPEIGVRLQLLALYAEMHIGDIEKTRLRLSTILDHLTERIEFDNQSEHQIYSLEYKADAFYKPEIAKIRIQSSVDYFAGDDSEIPRNITEAYKALTNLSACNLLNGDFNNAVLTAKRAESLTNNFSFLDYPRLDAPANNMLLGQFRLESINIDHAINQQELLFDSPQIKGDDLLIRNNLAIYYILAEDYQKSLDLLAGGVEFLVSSNNYEPYFNYLVFSNYAGVLHHLNKQQEAIDAWKHAGFYVDRIPFQSSKLYTRRYQIMEDAFDEIQPGDIKGWFEYPRVVSPNEYGPSWAHYGCGFLFTIIQFWSEL